MLLLLKGIFMLTLDKGLTERKERLHREREVERMELTRTNEDRRWDRDRCFSSCCSSREG
jgi:hypothetical protein